MDDAVDSADPVVLGGPDQLVLQLPRVPPAHRQLGAVHRHHLTGRGEPQLGAVRGRNLTIGGEEADRIASITSASTKIDVFTLDTASTPGESVEVLGNVIGGGNTELNLRYVVACPCGLETES